MKSDSGTDNQVTAALKVDDAVGVHKRQWFVAVVGRNTEKACREKLQNLGFETFVATQYETRIWRTGQKKKIERVIISTLIFIRATERERREVVNLPFIKYFLTDKAGQANDFGRHPLAVIPDEQMEKLRFMLFHADSPVCFTDNPLHLGDRIRVVRGSLQGLEGSVARTGDASHIAVHIDFLGYAMVDISLMDIERIA